MKNQMGGKKYVSYPLAFICASGLFFVYFKKIMVLMFWVL